MVYMHGPVALADAADHIPPRVDEVSLASSGTWHIRRKGVVVLPV